jgi:hypothetical protein
MQGRGGNGNSWACVMTALYLLAVAAAWGFQISTREDFGYRMPWQISGGLGTAAAGAAIAALAALVASSAFLSEPRGGIGLRRFSEWVRPCLPRVSSFRRWA